MRRASNLEFLPRLLFLSESSLGKPPIGEYMGDIFIIIQFLICKYKISEFSIPTFYGKEISYVNGLHYAYRIIVESLKANIQKLGLFYEKKYDLKHGKH